MIYLIKFIFFLFISFNSFANENKVNEIIFKINNKVFTNIDLEKRTKYVALISNLNHSEFSDLEKKEILNDYISSLIFYEYYIENKLVYKKLKEEVDLTFEKNFKNFEKINKEEIKNLKINTNLDLIRNKIIEEKLNSRKNILMKETSELDLLYNYNLQNIIIKENLIDNKLINKIDNRKEFNDLKIFLKENKIDFYFKEEDINDHTIISKTIKEIINQKKNIYKSIENGYINLISINKNLESFEGIFVKLINFTSKTSLEKEQLDCNNLNETIDINKTVFQEYEYSKLNKNIKNNLKSINDYIIFKDNNDYTYIILCDLTYDEKILKNVNFNKNVNSLVNKIQNKFLKKYKNEYNFIKIK